LDRTECVRSLILQLVAHRVQDQLNAMPLVVLRNPVYSSDLTPCNFYIFGRLKKPSRFTWDVAQWLRQQRKEFFAGGIRRLL
jgi:hypothetical protein